MTDVAERLEELRDRGLYRQLRLVSGPQGPRVLLGGRPVLLLCSNNYLGLADHPKVRGAAAEAAMRWGAGAGASRLVSGNAKPAAAPRTAAAGRVQGLARRHAVLGCWRRAILANTRRPPGRRRPASAWPEGEALQTRLASILEGTRLVAEKTNLKRCASIGHMSAERAKALKEAGVQRVHRNVESSRSYYPEVSTTVRYEGRLRTIQAVRRRAWRPASAASSTSARARSSGSRWPSS